MREILFKAKRIDNGEWVEGYLFKTQENTYIAYNNQFDDDLFLSPPNIFIVIDEKTICQYTGLTDKNGCKIWENDIMKYVWDGKECIDVIEYQEPIFTYSNSFRWSLYEDEVIGNIFDNPELLERGD